MNTTETLSLTDAQKRALRDYKRVHGKSWRMKLNTDWMKAYVTGVSDKTAHILYVLRNTHGLSWLASLKLKDFMRQPFKPVPSPFGTSGFKDEQATQDAFVEYVGGRQNAERLSRIWNNTYANNDPWKPVTKADVFRRKARNEGFEPEDIEAFMQL